MIDDYVAELARLVPGERRLLDEVRAHLLDSAAIHGPEEAIRRFGPPTLVASGHLRTIGKLTRRKPMPNPRERSCSFCGKSQEKVKRLIAGPNDVHICDQCVGLCNEIIAREEAKPA